MATKRVSVSGLPQLTNADLKNNPSDSTRTSFLVSSRRQVGGINTSYQLDYAQLYTAISSQIANQFNIKPTLGANNKPIYLAGQKFTASTQNIGSDGQFPITLRGGEFKPLPAIGSDIQPVYVNSSGRLTSSARNVGSTTQPIYMSAGKLQVSNANVGGNTSTVDYGITFTPIYMKAGQLIAADGNVGGCSYNGHTCTPIYMSGGALRPATSPIGSPTRPIYMDRGTLKESSATLGSPTKIMYMEGGVFKEGNEIVTMPDVSTTGPGWEFELIASVLFDDVTEGSDTVDEINMNLGGSWNTLSNISKEDYYEYSQEEFRYMRKQNGPYVNSPVSFWIPETGWYTIMLEAASKPCGVLVLKDVNWYGDGRDLRYYTKTNFMGQEITELNIVYFNQPANNMFTYTGYFSERTVIGVVSNLKNKKNSGTATIPLFNCQTKITGKYVAERTLYDNTWRTWKEIKNLDVATRNTIFDNKKYLYVCNTKKTKLLRYAYCRRKAKLSISSMEWGTEQWSDKDSIRLYKIRTNDNQ